MRAHSNALRRLVLLLFLSCCPYVLACEIVYGKDWAFISHTPEAWSSACHTEAMKGTVINLWPSKQPRDRADALIYATVSTKALPTLAAFSLDEQARFKQSSPISKVSSVPRPPRAAGIPYELVAISSAPGNREELVAYVEGPTAYFIVAITAESPAVLERYRATFLDYLDRFTPIERK